MSHAHHSDHGPDHGHGHEDPFLSGQGARRWAQWADVLETGTRAVSDALLDATHTGAGTRLLDLACGLGHTTHAAAQRGADAVGVDLNPHMLERARAKTGAQFELGDMNEPPAGPWDAIVSRFGAHHAPPEWLNAAVRTLAPGGRIAIAEWHPDTALFDVEPEHDGPTEDDAEDWVRRFEAAGLQDVEAGIVDFTIDFGDDATFVRFLEDMADGATSRAGAPGGQQHNRAYVVAGHR